MIGVNYGRVGFLASIERETLERDLRRALAGEYVVLGLPSLKAEWSDGEVQAVNDLALFRGGESRIADLTYAVDGELVATVRCDGAGLQHPGRLDGLQPRRRRARPSRGGCAASCSRSSPCTTSTAARW